MVKKLIGRLSASSSNSLLLPGLALRKVTAKSSKGGVYASSDVLFKGAIFGRDSVEVAEDLLFLKPKLVKGIILNLACLQGETYDDINEEEPGKIVHEYRSRIVDGKPISGMQLNIFEELSRRWGGNTDYVAYYGSADATPLYVRLVGAYCDRYGPQLLENRITLRSGHKLSLRLVVDNAVDWLTKKLRDSQSGLLEYKRRNSEGIENQVWKDSREFYVHEDGKPVNHQKPVSSIELQGITYDALLCASKLLPHRKNDLTDTAERLRNRTIELLWLQERQYFALGTDYSDAGKLRTIKTITANPAALLDTALLTGQKKEQMFISGIVNRIFSADFLTDAGIRSRALSAAHVVKFWDYHGSFVSWPKETYDIAKGLRRRGFPLLARELENRLLNVVRRSKAYLEFVYVDEHGRVLTGRPVTQEHGPVTLVDSTNEPELVQAWTVSAVLEIVSRRMSQKLVHKLPVTQEPWQRKLEEQLLSTIPRVDFYKRAVKLAARYPAYPYKVRKNTHVDFQEYFRDKVG